MPEIPQKRNTRGGITFLELAGNKGRKEESNHAESKQNNDNNGQCSFHCFNINNKKYATRFDVLYDYHMKINLPIVVGVVIIVVVIAAFFLLRGGGTATESAATESTDTASPSSAFATTLAPDMTLITTDNSKPQMVGSSTPTYVGDTLTTSHTGRGLLQWTNGSVTFLDYDTKLTLEESDSTGTHISGSLGAGAIWARVEKVFGKGEYYKIKTQNAVAVVRGTSFGVSYKGGITALQAATGTVSFMPVDPSTGEPLKDKEVLVSGGNKSTIDDSGLVRVSPLTAADKQAPWYLYNVSEVNVQAPAQAPVSAVSQKASLPVSASQQTAPQTKPATSGAIAPTPRTNVVSTENICASFSETSSQTGGSPLKLFSVSPFSVSQSSQDAVILSGEGFICAMTVTIGDKILSGESDFTVDSNSSVTISSGLLPIGTFDIVMEDSFGNTATLPKAITVTR